MQRISLRAKFIFVFLLIGLLSGLMMLFIFRTTTNSIINDLALNFATREALLEKNKVISIIEREVVLAQKMATDSTLIKWAENETNGEYEKWALENLESYRHLFRDKSFFVAIRKSNNYYVYNKEQGHERLERVTLKRDQPADVWFFNGLQEIKNYALNLDYDPTLQEIKIWINAVMRNARGDKIALCGGGINISEFLNEVIHQQNEGISTILIDRAGVIQAHKDQTIVEHNANTRSSEKITIYSLLDRIEEQTTLRSAIASLLSGQTDVQAFPVRVGGRDYLLAVSYMQGIDWLNIVLVDVSRVISAKAFLPIIAIMVLGLLTAILTIGILINRMMLKPLAELSRASRKIAEGDYNVQLPVTGRDEIGELTSSFNTMTTTIYDHTMNLEQKVQQRTDELTSANKLLKESQQRILESIHYARTIQTSILPESAMLARCLGEHFVIYRPKEEVGGDFYYLREFPEHALLAIIDCTGHGVPGAFMTMTVNSVLNHVIDVLCCNHPATILAELNRVMRQTLHLRDVDAGLDIAVCMIERQEGRLTYAGAGLTLTIVAAGQTREVHGDHQRIGYKGSKLDYVYHQKTIEVSPGSCCYLTSDGLLDEPGGKAGFGFGRDRFKTMLVEHAQLSMAMQRPIIEQVLCDYRGEQHQRDDITLIGFRW